MSQGAATGDAGTPSPPASPVPLSRVDLAMPHGSSVWHIAAGAHSLCGVGIADARYEIGVDARVVAHRGRNVCSRCRRKK